MTSDPPSGEHREKTVRVVKSDVESAGAADMVERYEYHFVHLIERHIKKPTQPVTALDLACGEGLATLTLTPNLPPGSRVVALSGNRKMLSRFDAKVPEKLRGSIFARKERRERLPFAIGAFDVAWASLATEPVEPLRRVLRQTLRVLRPGSQLLLAAPLRDTFVEMANAISNLAETSQNPEAFRMLNASSPDLLDIDGWATTMSRCGAVDVKVHYDSVEITIEPPFSERPLFTQKLLPLWLGDNESTQSRALALLDAAIDQPLTVTAHIACIIGHRGLSEMEDDSLSEG